MPNYEYRCDRGCTTDLVRPLGTEVTPCPSCGARATRTHAPTAFDVVGPTVDTRGMFRRFEEAVAEREHGYEKHETNTGEAVARPDDWSAAKAVARERVRRGEVDPKIARTFEHQSIRGVSL